MKRGVTTLALILMIFTLSVPSVKAQYFKFNQGTDLATANLEVEAILKYFGSMVGGGLYHTADMHNIGGLDVGLTGIVSKVPDEFQSLPVFIDEDKLGLAFLHGSFGLPGNLEIIGRFFYFPIGSDANSNLQRQDSRGGVTIIGGGLKYGLLQMPGIPKIMVMGTYHALFVPSEFDFGTVGTLSFNAVVSHSLAILTAYVGGGIDITTLKVDKDVPIPGFAGKRFTENTTHATIGANISVFPFVHVNGAVNLGKFNSVDLGVFLSIR